MKKPENNRYIEKEDLYKILDKNISWIENCDSKTSIALGAIGVAIALFLSSDYIVIVKKIFNFMKSEMSILSIAYLVILCLSGCIIIGGLVFLAKVLFAKTNDDEFKSLAANNNSLIFFSTVSKIKEFQTYRKLVNKCSDEEYRDDLISQILICAHICDKKFKNYKTGLFLSLVGFGSFLSFLFIGIALI